jgi:hypothetical protein
LTKLQLADIFLLLFQLLAKLLFSGTSLQQTDELNYSCQNEIGAAQLKAKEFYIIIVVKGCFL